MKKYNWKKILVQILWLLAGVGLIILFGAAVHEKNQKNCVDINIEIIGAEQHMFIDEKDVLSIINARNVIIGTNLSSLHLREMETALEKNLWVKNAEVFLDNNEFLQIRIQERQPVARVFTLEGSSFYVDSNSLRLPLSEKISARLPTFTGFPSNKEILAKPDSLLLNQIVKLGKFIQTDSFWMAQIAQIDITPQACFELVPVIGDHFVVLGNAEDLTAKFNRLYSFYRQAWLQNGISTYEKLDIQYSGQVVAVRRGTSKTMVDSIKLHQIMLDLLNQRESRLTDSSYLNITIKNSTINYGKDSSGKPNLNSGLVPPSGQGNSKDIENNKSDAKPLLNKNKTNTKKSSKKMPKEKVIKPKALMDKNRET